MKSNFYATFYRRSKITGDLAVEYSKYFDHSKAQATRSAKIKAKETGWRLYKIQEVSSLNDLLIV